MKTEKATFGVTACHVYDEFATQVAENAKLICQINNYSISLTERLIDQSKVCDVAIFRITPSELTGIDIDPVPWPPRIPATGQSVMIAGFPGLGKKFIHSGILNFSLYHAITGIDSVNDRDLSMLFPPDEELVDISGKGLPPRNFELGGMSGGPVISVMENGVMSWALAGIIYQCSPTFEIVEAIRADVIREDGSLSC